MLRLPAELNHASANACLAQLAEGLSTEAAEVVVDAQALQHFDSSALAVLIEFRRACSGAGKALIVQGLPPRLRDLAALYGVEELLLSA